MVPRSWSSDPALTRHDGAAGRAAGAHLLRLKVWLRCVDVDIRVSIEGYPKVRKDFTITEKAFNRKVLNVKALVGTFNQEKVLIGAFSVIVNLRVPSDNLRLKL